MKASRQAVVFVDRQLLEELLPGFKTAALLRFGELLLEELLSGFENSTERLADLAGPFHMALKLPGNCRITGASSLRSAPWPAGISPHHRFEYDQVAFRIECPDFVETAPGNMLPIVGAVYQNSLDMRVTGPGMNQDGFAPGSVEVVGSSGYFLRWDGSAVAVRREYGSDGVEVMASRSKACPLLTWDEYRAAVNWCVANFGAAYVWKIHDKLGAEVERWVLPSGWVRRRNDDSYGVELPGSRMALLPVAEVEVLTKTVGAALADGVEVMKRLQQWASSGEKFQGGSFGPGVGELLDCHQELTAVQCWKCHSSTTRRLPDGTAECQECAEGSLL